MVATPEPRMTPAAAGLSRRQLLRRGGVFGALLIVTPDRGAQPGPGLGPGARRAVARGDGDADRAGARHLSARPGARPVLRHRRQGLRHPGRRGPGGQGDARRPASPISIPAPGGSYRAPRLGGRARRDPARGGDRRRSSRPCAAASSPGSTTSRTSGRSSATRASPIPRAAISTAASTTSNGCEPRLGRTIMAAPYALDDASVVVIIGSGAGGGTLGNELAQKGIDVVILEAGPRVEYEDFQNDEWGSFSQISWLDPRTTSGDWRVARDFPGLPAWIVKAVGGSTTHWAGASLRFQEHEFKALTSYGDGGGGDAARLADHAGGNGALLRQGRGQDGGDQHQRHRAPARQQQLQGAEGGGRRARLHEMPHRQHGDQFGRPRRAHGLPADRLLLPGLQVGREMVDALFRDPQGRGDRQAGGAAERPGAEDRARRPAAR